MTKYDNAIADYDKALQIEPSSIDALRSRGVAYLHKDDYDSAMQDFNEVIGLKPNDADAHNDRGIVYNTERQYDGAIADYSKALELDPKNADALYSRGIAKQNEDDIAPARRLIRRQLLRSIPMLQARSERLRLRLRRQRLIRHKLNRALPA